MKTAMHYIITGVLLMGSAVAFMASSLQKKQQLTNELVTTNVDGKGTSLVMSFTAGESHNHPTLAVWIEDMQGNYIQTLYVTKSLATGVYGHGAKAPGVWKKDEGEARRPATLPYFLHKRNMPAFDGTFLPTPQNPIPDVYTGATPKAGFDLDTKLDKPFKGKFRLLVEVNQTWDWNEYWTNNKFPDDAEYKTSCQPALVYAVTIDTEKPMEKYSLNPIGHSHYSGQDGNLYTDISTLTTALQIFSKIDAQFKK